jgi:hypothetical protein
VIGPERANPMVFRRIARRVEDILEAARDRETKGQTLALDIDARFRLQDLSAVQFQLASAILEEMGGLRQEEVVGELLAMGLAAVLNGAAKAVTSPGAADRGEEPFDGVEDEALAGLLSGPLVMAGTRDRVVN